MTKIFRLHKEGNNNIVDWQVSEVYGDNVIKQIEDPDGATARKVITSIPSPFARIDLVKTAFREVVNMSRKKKDQDDNILDGTTIYHRMVSDSLDVGEIFFNSDRLLKEIEIIIWDTSNDLEALINSNQKEHQAIGNTLKMYLQQDAETYNFAKMGRIYLLNYIGPNKPAPMNIIGATSPATLFFSSANDLSYISEHIAFGQDRPFDIDFQPLNKRDFEFQKYLYTFRCSFPDFARSFPEFNEFLNTNYGLLPDDKKRIIDQLDENSINNYQSIDLEARANYVEILGHPLHKKNNLSNVTSDFEIKSEIYTEGKKPLVLPIEPGITYAKHLFVQDCWHQNDKAPYFDPIPWIDRTLPISNISYPYLTISDFLKDTIVRMPYELNQEFYFDGNISNNTEGSSYLLPLSNLFFEFFTTEQLMGEMPNGKKMYEIRENSGGVTVTLRIPIKKSYIEYNRIYFTDNESDISRNEGAVINQNFGMGLFPFISFDENTKQHYRIAISDNGKKDISLSCFNKNTPIPIEAKVCRRNKKPNSSVEAYVINHNFDRINVRVGTTTCAIIPKFKTSNGSSQYVFAIDFGTTNTHIEYSIDNSPSKAFDILTHEKQIQRLHKDYRQAKDIEASFEDSFIPDTIGVTDVYSFPLRSIFSEYKGIDYKRNSYVLADGNIPFRYEKRAIPDYNKVHTDLKWSIKDDKRVQLYLENLFLLMRNKVLMNTNNPGRLDDTKIIWFYPASMTEAHCNRMRSLWHTLYKKYMGEDSEKNVISMSESIAPYNFFYKKRGATSNVVTIDIGGGTSDVYVVDNGIPSMLSSFRFASNSIFGDGYNLDSDNNGFVKAYSEYFIGLLKANKLNELEITFNSIVDRKRSPDIAAFLFSLSSNKEVNLNDAFDFLKQLSGNRKLKYVFVLFYTSIFYFVACSMKAKGLKKPTTVAFSGNGSRTLKILSDNNSTIQKYVKIIFENIFEEKYDEYTNLEIKFEEEPKTATCKGGIITPINQDFDKIDKLKFSLIGFDKVSFSDKVYKYSDISDEKQDEVVGEIIDFINFTFDLHTNNNSLFTNLFDIDASIIDQVKRICKDKLKEYLKLGIEKKKEELRSLGADDVIDETLFFYPLVGMLQNVALKVTEIK